MLRSFRLVPGHPTAEQVVSLSISYPDLKEGKEEKICFLLFRLHGGRVESFLGLYVGSGVGRNVWRDCLLLTAAGLAQSVERLTAEREVAGSIPGAGPILRVLN